MAERVNTTNTTNAEFLDASLKSLKQALISRADVLDRQNAYPLGIGLDTPNIAEVRKLIAAEFRILAEELTRQWPNA